MIPRNLQITGAMVLLALTMAAIYGVQLKRRDELNRRQGAQPLPLIPVSVAPAKFTALLAFDDDGILSESELSAPLPGETGERARMLLRTVLHEYMQSPSPHAIPPGSDVRAVYLTADGLCVVDLNATLADQHRSGMLIEQFTLMSLLETLSANVPEIRRIKVLVEGKERASLAGHADLSGVFEVEAVHAAVKGYMHR